MARGITVWLSWSPTPMAAKRTSVTQLVNGPDWLDWSPDGAQIAFLSRPRPTAGGVINIVNVDGSGLQTLDVGQPANGFPSWLPPRWQ